MHHWSDPERARRWDAGHIQGNPVRGPHLELVLALLEEAEPGWCLDLGCGSGLVAELVLDRHPDLAVLGLDGSEPMLAMAQERLERFAQRALLAAVDLGDAAQLAALKVPSPATVALAVQALHHLHRPQLEATLAWVRQRLTGGAVLAIVDPVLIPSAGLYRLYRRAKANLGWRWNPDSFEEYGGGLAEGHDRLLPLEDYLAVVRGAGFDAACLDLRADRALLIGRVP